jgi:tetratricopeptide (TPR) repeat protein
MDEKTAARIGVVLCEALAAVHSAGLLHRDIKAGNAMRDENGRVLLMDFGLSQDLLGVSNIAGTPGYLAPEVRAGSPGNRAERPLRNGRSAPLSDHGTTLPRTGDRCAAYSIPAGLGAGPSQGNRSRSETALRERGADGEGARGPDSARTRRAQAPMAGTPPSRWKRSLDRSTRASRARRGHCACPAFPWQMARNGAPGAGSPAYQGYLAAEDALLRYDKPGNTDKAIALYLSALRRTPKDALALRPGLARAYRRKYLDLSESKWADAATQASAKAMEMNPDLAAGADDGGHDPCGPGQVRCRLAGTTARPATGPAQCGCSRGDGEAYRQQGRLADAKNELQTAMDLAPENWRWPYLLGALQIDSGDFRSAEQNMNVALAKTQDNARILYNLGIVYRKEDRLMEAQTALEKSITPDGRADPMMELGQVSLQRGEYQNAIDWFLRAVQLSPSDYDAWGNLAAAYQGSGQHPTEAANAYRKAAALAEEELKTTPDKSFLVSVLGEYYANLHDESHALPLAAQGCGFGARRSGSAGARGGIL